MPEHASTGALLREVLFAAHRAGVDVRLAARDDGNYEATVGDAVACAPTLDGLLHDIIGQLIEPNTVTTIDAARRMRVRLPEGGLGVLTKVSTRARIATVRTDEGRWRHLPAAALTIYTED